MRDSSLAAATWTPLFGVLAGGMLLPRALAGGWTKVAAVGLDAPWSASVDPDRATSGTLVAMAAGLQGLSSLALLLGRRVRVAASVAGAAAALPWRADLRSGGPWSRCGELIVSMGLVLLAWMARGSETPGGAGTCVLRR